jgi:ribonuclease HII
MKLFKKEKDIEAGVDEVARGCLFGRVYTAAVVWPQENDPDSVHPLMKDSKQFNRVKRKIMRDYVLDNAIDYCISYMDNDVVDDVNILNATHQCMHKSLDGLNVPLTNILVDGNKFNPYISIDGDVGYTPHECIIKGDTKFYSIAAASILAKVAHDEYIVDVCKKYPELHERYDLLNNMGYGTEKHLDGIRKYGITNWHRISFSPCSEHSDKMSKFD